MSVSSWQLFARMDRLRELQAKLTAFGNAQVLPANDGEAIAAQDAQIIEGPWQDRRLRHPSTALREEQVELAIVDEMTGRASS